MYDSSLIASVGYILSTTIAITAGKGGDCWISVSYLSSSDVTPVSRDEVPPLAKGQFY